MGEVLVLAALVFIPEWTIRYWQAWVFTVVFVLSTNAGRARVSGSAGAGNGGQTISLAPLSDSETTALLDELLGPDPSVLGIPALVGRRAAGNPVLRRRDGARTGRGGVLRGERGEYKSTAEISEISVPAPCRRPSPPVSTASILMQNRR